MTEAVEAQSDAPVPAAEARRPWGVYLGWGLVVFGLVLAFGLNFREMWVRWFPAWRYADMSLYDRLVEGESYYTHGPLVPAVSLFILSMLVKYTRIEVRPRRVLGGVVTGGFLVLHLLSSLARVNFLSGFAFIGVLAGLILFFWGLSALKRFWFPLAFLAFMVPLPEVSIARLNFSLKVFAADWGVRLANGVGMIAERTGNRVFLTGGKSLVVANVCNGLRTLISLLAFGALYVYVCRLRGLWRVFLFAMTIPVAIVSNSLRIVSLILVADVWTVEAATGWYHDFSGLLIFILAFMLMFGIERAILGARKLLGKPADVRPLFEGVRRDATDEGQWGRMARSVGVRAGVPVGAVLIVVAGGAWWFHRSVPSGLSQQMIRDAVPRQLVVNDLAFDSYEMKLDRQTLTILENPSYISRQYVSSRSQPIQLSLIYSQDNRKGTHPPDLCLEGSGEGIVAKRDVRIPLPDLPAVPCRELLVQTGRQRMIFLYTYKCGEQYTSSFIFQQWTILLNGLLDRNASGALVRVSTPVRSDLELARQRCKAMMEQVLPHLNENLP